MSDKETMINELTKEQVEQVSGGGVDILANYLAFRSEDTKSMK